MRWTFKASDIDVKLRNSLYAALGRAMKAAPAAAVVLSSWRTLHASIFDTSLRIKQSPSNFTVYFLLGGMGGGWAAAPAQFIPELPQLCGPRSVIVGSLGPKPPWGCPQDHPCRRGSHQENKLIVFTDLISPHAMFTQRQARWAEDSKDRKRKFSFLQEQRYSH